MQSLTQSQSTPDPAFVSNLYQIKQSLYKTYVFGPSLNSEKAQDNAVLNDYLQGLNRLYDLSLRAQKGNAISEDRMKGFPSDIQPSIRAVLEWIRAYFQKNAPVKTIPYTHYIERALRIYPFVQQPMQEDGAGGQQQPQQSFNEDDDARNYL